MQKLSDEEFSLPKHRRNIFEHGEDVTRMNWYLLLVSLASLLLAICLGVILLSIYFRPPYILSEDDGFVQYRSAVVFTLDESRVKTYLNMVLGKLFDSNPGVYDLTEMIPFVDEKIIKGYTKYFADNSAERARENERRLFQMYDVRQLPNDNPKQITAVVKGDMAFFRDSKTVIDATTGATAPTTRVVSQVSTYLVYVDIVRPTPTNPWGLVTREIIEPKSTEAANQLWEHSRHFYKTIQDGKVISKIQRDALLENAMPTGTQPSTGKP